MQNNLLKYRCYFCNTMIMPDQVDPCDVNVQINWDKSRAQQQNQTFWCHAQCFKLALHPQIRGYFMMDLD